MSAGAKDLLWFVLSWAMRRRPGNEREALLQAAVESQQEAEHRREVETMSKVLRQRWEDELLERGEARGEARGEVRGRLNAGRDHLRILLEQRFGAVPETVAQRLDSLDDLQRLETAIRDVLRIERPEDLDL